MKERSELRLLAVFAHPDDESFGVGGTLARYAAEGVEVHLACATRGEAGGVGDPPLCAQGQLGKLREEELRAPSSAIDPEAFSEQLAAGLQPWSVSHLYYLAPSRSTAVACEGVGAEEDEAAATTRIDVCPYLRVLQNSPALRRSGAATSFTSLTLELTAQLNLNSPAPPPVGGCDGADKSAVEAFAQQRRQPRLNSATLWTQGLLDALGWRTGEGDWPGT